MQGSGIGNSRNKQHFRYTLHASGGMLFVWRDAPEERLPAASEGKADEAAAT
jgi:hypothetical protein